jgi:hypothetical protein
MYLVASKKCTCTWYLVPGTVCIIYTGTGRPSAGRRDAEQVLEAPQFPTKFWEAKKQTAKITASASDSFGVAVRRFQSTLIF